MKHFRRKIYRDKELIERLRQYTIVCEVEMRLRQKHGTAYVRRNLSQLGMDQFDLTKAETAVCTSRARDYLDKRMRMKPIGN